MHRIRADHQGFWATFPSVIQKDKALVSWLQNCSTVSTSRDYKLLMKLQGCDLVKMRLAYHRFIDYNYRSLYPVSTTGCLHSAEIMGSRGGEQHISTGTSERNRVNDTEQCLRAQSVRHPAMGWLHLPSVKQMRAFDFMLCVPFMSFLKLWRTALCVFAEGKGWLVWEEKKLTMRFANTSFCLSAQRKKCCAEQSIQKREEIRQFHNWCCWECLWWFAEIMAPNSLVLWPRFSVLFPLILTHCSAATLMCGFLVWYFFELLQFSKLFFSLQQIKLPCPGFRDSAYASS